MLTFGVPALLVGALAVVLIARGMPSFLRENENLPLLQNFVITPAASESEPTVRLARESLAPAVVQSGPGQSDEAASSGAVAAGVTDATPTPTPDEPDTTADGTQAGTILTPTAVPPTEMQAATDTPVAEEPTSSVAVVENTVTPPPTPSPLPTVTQTVTVTETATETPTAIPTPAWLTYTIRAGDTIGAIARRFGISQEALLQANDLSPQDVTRLQIGDVILLPGILQATPTPTPTEVVNETPSATPAG